MNKKDSNFHAINNQEDPSFSPCPVFLQERSMSDIPISGIDADIGRLDPSTFIKQQGQNLPFSATTEHHHQIYYSSTLSTAEHNIEMPPDSRLWRPFVQQIERALSLEDSDSSVFDLDKNFPSLDKTSTIDEGFHHNRSMNGKNVMNESNEEENEKQTIIAKKRDHNAKERQRRMKLRATYSALRSLLPNSGRTKKRWSSGKIIDKVLEYIPTIEKEIEMLTEKKKNIENDRVMVSAHEVRKGEVIVQICIRRDRHDDFSTLLQNVEDEGMHIVSASTMSVSDEILCCHLQIQMNGSRPIEEEQYVSTLREKKQLQGS